MRPPVETNTLPPDLAARFAALRGANVEPPTSSPSKDTDEDLARRLERLETPTKGEGSAKVRVEVRTPPAGLSSKADEEDPISHFLSLPSSSPPPLPSHATRFDARPVGLPSLLSLSRGAEEKASGVEVLFMRPSLGAAVGDGAEGGAGEEEGELMSRMKEEVELEERVRQRDEASAEGWEKRLAGLRGVVPSSTSSTSSAVPPPDVLKDAPPRVDELEEAMRRRERRRRKKEDSDEETSSGESSSEEEDGETSESGDSEEGEDSDA
ncbi:hypothetical protein JCM10213_007180 [Rhodosporidiobolus nylandii]